MKVHVLCPASSVTGGPEALHQLVDAGQCLGYDMAMVYLPEDDPDPTPEVFKMYRPRVVREVLDSPDSVVIVPETGTLQFLSLRHATRALWWLSVEHFLMRSEAMRQQQGTAQSPMDFVFDPRFGVVHLAQSEYARLWVERKGASAMMLTDYVRDEIVQRARSLRSGAKEDIVAYNPKKGLEFTRQLMALSPPQIRWVPIENMSPAEVAQLLGRSKVYVDFGPHPGRDRIPREAALCGCVVITNTQGSAGNAIDVPIPPRFKFDERHPLTVPLVLQRIAEAMGDHASLAAEMAPYRAAIEDQRRVFIEEAFVMLSTLEAEHARNRLQRLAA
ncbi:hypothetical protein [Ideonella sp.]|uniref:hypothetical protein n=1 Tax=Ideonella sp. TaxID=1929293 RepID=UPI003BB61CB3